MEDYNNLVNALQEAGMSNSIISNAREQQKQDITGGITPIASILGIEGLKEAGMAGAKALASQGLQKVAGISGEQATAIVNGDLGTLKNVAINLVAKKAGIELPENATLEDIGNAVKASVIRTVGEKAGIQGLTGNETPEELLNLAKSTAIKTVGEKAGIEGLTGNETPEEMINLLKTNALEQLSTKAGVAIPEGATSEDIIATLSQQAPEVLARVGITLPTSATGEASVLDATSAIRSAVAGQINEATGLSLTGAETSAEDFAGAFGKLAIQTIAQKTGIAIPENLELSQSGIINGLKSMVASKIESVTGVKINPDASVQEIGDSLLEQGKTIVSDQLASVTGASTGEGIALPSFEIPSALPSISLPSLAEIQANPFEALSTTLSNVTSSATEAISGATQAVSGAVSGISQAVTGATQAVTEATQAVTGATEALSNVASGVSQAVSGATEAVSGVSQSVNALGVVLPSSVFSPVLAPDRLLEPLTGIAQEEDLSSQAVRLLSQPSEALASTTSTPFYTTSIQTGEGSMAPVAETSFSTGEPIAVQAGTTEAEATASTGEAVGESTGEAVGESTATAVGEATAEATGIAVGDVLGVVGSALGPLGLLAGLGTSIYSIFEGVKHEDLPPPLNPSVQFGA